MTRQAKPPCKRPRLMRQLRNMYELERACDKSAANLAFLALPDECRGVLCLVMFYGRCKSRGPRWARMRKRDEILLEVV